MMQENSSTRGPDLPSEVELPAPTAWPIVLALGTTLLFAGLLTSADVSMLGTVLVVVGSVGWFREVLPEEHHEMVPAERAEVQIVTTRTDVTRAIIAPEISRLRIPVEIYPVSAGIKGGLAGGLTEWPCSPRFTGFSGHGSIWYPINLLAGPSSTPSRYSFRWSISPLSIYCCFWSPFCFTW